jgi:hypothetical protein
MALNTGIFKADLLSLYNSMWNRASKQPMTVSEYAAKMAKLMDDQTKTADVLAGISVTGVSATGGPVTGSTNALGIIK